jgi:hypothetical protein
MEKKQTIKCDVDHCKYFCDEHLCTLKEIKVAKCDCEEEHEDKRHSTLCGSYENEEDND